MATIKSFKLSNFKGIKDVTIDLEGKAKCPVITLIGLNEGGKTTILEGISHFISANGAVSALFGKSQNSDATSLIPIDLKANFTGDVEIGGLIQLSPEDIEEAVNILKRHKLKLNTDILVEPFWARRVFQFEDSKLNTDGYLHYWNIPLEVRKTASGKWMQYERPEDRAEDAWLEVVRAIEKRLPLLSYYPTFLVDMPSKIYLQEHQNELPVNRYYRTVLQDILDSSGDGLSLERHVCERIREYKVLKSHGWLATFYTSSQKNLIDSVFQRMSHAITKEVIGSWQNVFQRAISAKAIHLSWYIDPEKGELPYATFQVTDGGATYNISERSLGFRWFFSFLLFTAFKTKQDRSTIFIFDEPAANLHAKAQAELMKSFSRIASGHNKVIYSTHSHHMINPQWLSGGYIVQNAALDFDSDDSFGLDTKPTEITATRYRDFVSQYPTRSSYFQPVIEKLEYVTPEIVGEEPYLIVEGITDFYALRLTILNNNLNLPFRIMPGTGAGSSGTLISMLLGRGEKFAILLDDDNAGRAAKHKYINEWFLASNQAFTLGDLSNEYSDMQLERLLLQKSVELIKKNLGLHSAPNKKQLGWYLAESCAQTEHKGYLTKETYDDLAKVLRDVAAKLDSI